MPDATPHHPPHHSATEHLAIDLGIVIHAWGALMRGLRRLPLLFASAILTTGVLTWAAWEMQAPLHGWLSTVPPSLRDPVDFGYTLIVTVLDSLVLAATAIPIHRMILLGEMRDGLVPLFRVRTYRFAFWLVALQMGAFLALLPLPLLLQVSPVTDVAIIAAMAAFLLGLFYVAVRLSFAFSAIAIDVGGFRGRFEASWILSHGHFWKIVVTLVFAMVPLLFLILLVTLAGSWLIGLTGPMIDLMGTLMWFEVVVTALSRPLAAALAAGVLSWNYSFAKEEFGQR